MQTMSESDDSFVSTNGTPKSDEYEAESPSMEALPVSVDVLDEILASPRQRFVLTFLLEHDGRGTLNGIADQLANAENESSIKAATQHTNASCYNYLYHVALPELDNHGFLTFDPGTGKVTATDQLEAIAPLLTLVSKLDSRLREGSQGRVRF